MAAFATTELAETRAKSKTADGTWNEAHAARTAGGTICVRALRFASLADDSGYGAWAELTDNGAT